MASKPYIVLVIAGWACRVASAIEQIAIHTGGANIASTNTLLARIQAYLTGTRNRTRKVSTGACGETSIIVPVLTSWATRTIINPVGTRETGAGALLTF